MRTEESEKGELEILRLGTEVSSLKTWRWGQSCWIWQQEISIIRMKHVMYSMHPAKIFLVSALQLKWAGCQRLSARKLSHWQTNSLEQNRSSEANDRLATQELPRLVWNPRVRHRVHNSLPLIPILGHDWGPHPSILFNFHFNIIFRLGSSLFRLLQDGLEEQISLTF